MALFPEVLERVFGVPATPQGSLCPLTHIALEAIIQIELAAARQCHPRPSKLWASIKGLKT